MAWKASPSPGFCGGVKLSLLDRGESVAELTLTRFPSVTDLSLLRKER